MNTDEIRETFLKFFEQHGHTVKPSSSLIPAKDPSLLFTNAGMVPFKDQFLGIDTPKSLKVVSSQRCLRAGGKHNDLDNVGYTSRHHTFFEMLGNFSFGDYFKEQAISLAWSFLTESLGLSPEKLWVTTYYQDEQAREIWLAQGVDPRRMSQCGDADNFWSMGETGPCGPCTEIFYDHGPAVPGTEPGDDHTGDRYVEIWNLVFMQFNRDASGQLTDLPKPCVDTGMGLERIAAVMQGLQDNYQIDIFQPIYDSIQANSPSKKIDFVAMKVIADHARAATFMVWDQIHPSNEGRGYVLRRIIRRALRFGFQQGLDKPFLSKVVASVGSVMAAAYPKLTREIDRIASVIHLEETQFARTLASGLKLLNTHLETTGDIPGELVFKLYDSYGFPADLTRDIAREKQVAIDWDGFSLCMSEQKSRSRSHQKFKAAGQDGFATLPQVNTAFCGYESSSANSTLCYLCQEGQQVDSLSQGDEGYMVTELTPFYAESGGQVGDIGLIKAEAGEFQVNDTQRHGPVVVHHGIVTAGQLRHGDSVSLVVDPVRNQTMKNHTATHILHAALRSILGEGVFQKGSLVEPNRLRFDFSHGSALSQQQINSVEQWVNACIQQNLDVMSQEMPLEVAKEKGVMALFDEKYDDQVRVLSIGSVSHELCGGTHVDNTGSIGYFKVISESSVASGVRRIEAVTGLGAYRWLDKKYSILQEASHLLATSVDHVLDALNQHTSQSQQLSHAYGVLEQQYAQTIAKQINTVDGSPLGQGYLLCSQINQCDELKRLRLVFDACQSTAPHEYVMVLLGRVDQGGYCPFIIAVSEAASTKLTAKDVLNYLKKQIDVRGGGKHRMVQGSLCYAGMEDLKGNVTAWIGRNIT